MKKSMVTAFKNQITSPNNAMANVLNEYTDFKAFQAKQGPQKGTGVEELHYAMVQVLQLKREVL